jgi:hypothetical protein
VVDQAVQAVVVMVQAIQVEHQVMVLLIQAVVVEAVLLTEHQVDQV